MKEDLLVMRGSPSLEASLPDKVLAGAQVLTPSSQWNSQRRMGNGR